MVRCGRTVALDDVGSCPAEVLTRRGGATFFSMWQLRGVPGMCFEHSPKEYQ